MSAKLQHDARIAQVTAALEGDKAALAAFNALMDAAPRVVADEEEIKQWMERAHKGATVYDVLQCLKGENAELRAALKQSHQQSRRYRYLRNECHSQWRHPIVVAQEKDGDRMRYTGPLQGEALGKAIDTALGEVSETGL